MTPKNKLLLWMFWEENAQKTNYMSESGTKKWHFCKSKEIISSPDINYNPAWIFMGYVVASIYISAIQKVGPESEK